MPKLVKKIILLFSEKNSVNMDQVYLMQESYPIYISQPATFCFFDFSDL